MPVLNYHFTSKIPPPRRILTAEIKVSALMEGSSLYQMQLIPITLFKLGSLSKLFCQVYHSTAHMICFFNGHFPQCVKICRSYIALSRKITMNSQVHTPATRLAGQIAYAMQ